MSWTVKSFNLCAPIIDRKNLWGHRRRNGLSRQLREIYLTSRMVPIASPATIFRKQSYRQIVDGTTTGLMIYVLAAVNRLYTETRARYRVYRIEATVALSIIECENNISFSLFLIFIYQLSF